MNINLNYRLNSSGRLYSPSNLNFHLRNDWWVWLWQLLWSAAFNFSEPTIHFLHDNGRVAPDGFVHEALECGHIECRCCCSSSGVGLVHRDVEVNARCGSLEWLASNC